MTENSQTVAATMVGAVIGGIVGFLFFTDRGRDIRRQIEPAVDDVARELDSIRTTVQRVTAVANEGWNAYNAVMAEPKGSARHQSGPHQTSPF